MSTELNKNQGLLEAALEIAQQRRNTLVLVKQAIRRKDLAEADRLITELVPDEEVYRTSARKHVGPGGDGSRVITFAAKRKPSNG